MRMDCRYAAAHLDTFARAVAAVLGSPVNPHRPPAGAQHARLGGPATIVAGLRHGALRDEVSGTVFLFTFPAIAGYACRSNSAGAVQARAARAARAAHSRCPRTQCRGRCRRGPPAPGCAVFLDAAARPRPTRLCNLGAGMLHRPRRGPGQRATYDDHPSGRCGRAWWGGRRPQRSASAGRRCWRPARERARTRDAGVSSLPHLMTSAPDAAAFGSGVSLPGGDLAGDGPVLVEMHLRESFRAPGFYARLV